MQQTNIIQMDSTNEYYLLILYSKTSPNRTLLFQKVVRFSKISVYTRCRIAPANRTKFGLGGGFSDVLDRSSKPSKVSY